MGGTALVPPSKLLLYTGGISALTAPNYANLYSLLNVQIQNPRNNTENIPLIIPTINESLDVARTNIWKHVPGHERNYVPESEYAFKETQPKVEDLFFLGKSYETLFDQFEMLLSLNYAHLKWEERTGLESGDQLDGFGGNSAALGLHQTPSLVCVRRRIPRRTGGSL